MTNSLTKFSHYSNKEHKVTNFQFYIEFFYLEIKNLSKVKRKYL